MFISGAHELQNELARRFRHEGIRVGEITAYRAWRVIEPTWLREPDDRLHSVYVQDYVWPLDEPARGDVRTHGIYSFRDVIRCGADYGYALGTAGPLLFGRVKIWGEIASMKQATGQNLRRSSASITAVLSFWTSSGQFTN